MSQQFCDPSLDPRKQMCPVSPAPEINQSSIFPEYYDSTLTPDASQPNCLFSNYADEDLYAAPPPSPPLTKGMFPGVVDYDLTGKEDPRPSEIDSKTNKPKRGLKDLEVGDMGTVRRIVYHRTGNPNSKATIADYRNKAKAKSGRAAAHYLIDNPDVHQKDQDKAHHADTFLTIPTDKLAGHTQPPNKGPTAGHQYNPESIGIEIDGEMTNVSSALNKPDGVLRERIESLTLSPRFKNRLLDYDDTKLNQVFNAYGGGIYEDISPAQKRSVWNLTQKLLGDENLAADADSSSVHRTGEDGAYQQPGVLNAHEHLDAKKLGEGENTLEFVQTMRSYTKKGGLVDQYRRRISALEQQGSTDPAHLQKIADMKAVLEKEEMTQQALAKDGDLDEKRLLEQEKQNLKPGEEAGPATKREQARREFYDNFYERMDALRPEDERLLNRRKPTANSAAPVPELPGGQCRIDGTYEDPIGIGGTKMSPATSH